MREITKDNPIEATDKRYLQLLNEARQKISSTRIQVARAASRSQFELYWWLGEQIVTAQKKHGWGRSIIEQLALDLRKTFRNHPWIFNAKPLEYEEDL